MVTEQALRIWVAAVQAAPTADAKVDAMVLQWIPFTEAQYQWHTIKASGIVDVFYKLAASHEDLEDRKLVRTRLRSISTTLTPKPSSDKPEASGILFASVLDFLHYHEVKMQRDFAPLLRSHGPRVLQQALRISQISRVMEAGDEGLQSNLYLSICRHLFALCSTFPQPEVLYVKVPPCHKTNCTKL